MGLDYRTGSILSPVLFEDVDTSITIVNEIPAVTDVW